MNPAFSVIFLTTLCGVGQGLFLALFTVEAGARFGMLPLPGSGFFVGGSMLSLVFLAAGLIASFWHLGHPERAWRAIARWRTSWLSRECLALPAFMAAVFFYGAAHYAASAAAPWLGLLGVVLCVVLFVCTGMIYACIKFLQEWHTPLTVVNYTVLGCASGFMLAMAFAAAAAPALAAPLGTGAIVLTVAGLVVRAATLMRNTRLRHKSTLQSAIGVKHPRIAQISQGSIGGSFNTREFFHGRARTTLRAIKWLFLVLAFLLPVALVYAGLYTESVAVLIAAFAVQYAGLLLERWFFFAQANHPQNLYYQVVS
ncbi:MAG TPA: DmsC/YnfH family molybdoenzyme membrane anchor subunit [Burkholderiales bacterium]|nr:DmsC/YnfH family molybdoenzyme membrane anchor subunit [Burkholderiales bacterium]